MPKLRFWLLALAVALAPQACIAQAFPTKPIRFILGFAPGGSADVVARAIQTHLERQLGQPIIIEHRTGAGGVIAVDAVAKLTVTPASWSARTPGPAMDWSRSRTAWARWSWARLPAGPPS